MEVPSQCGRILWAWLDERMDDPSEMRIQGIIRAMNNDRKQERDEALSIDDQ